MGWKKSAAKKLDNAAAALCRAGKKVGGENGGRAGDAVASAVVGPIRACFDGGCTRCARGECEGA